MSWAVLRKVAFVVVEVAAHVVALWVILKVALAAQQVLALPNSEAWNILHTATSLSHGMFGVMLVALCGRELDNAVTRHVGISYSTSVSAASIVLMVASILLDVASVPSDSVTSWHLWMSAISATCVVLSYIAFCVSYLLYRNAYANCCQAFMRPDAPPEEE